MIITAYKVYVYDSPFQNDKGWGYSLQIAPLANWIQSSKYLLGEIQVELNDHYSVCETALMGKKIFRKDMISGSGLTLEYALGAGIAKIIGPDPEEFLTIGLTYNHRIQQETTPAKKGATMTRKLSAFVYSPWWMVTMCCLSLFAVIICIIGHLHLSLLIPNAFLACFWGVLIFLVVQENRQQRKDGHNESANKVG
jgi:hypothetical protein